MPLNWSIEKIKDKDKVCLQGEEQPDGSRRLSSTTETLIYCTMIVGLCDITEKNWMEFWYRLALYERLNGALRNRWRGDSTDPLPIYFSQEEIKSHIGLGTNAGNSPRGQWVRHTLKNYEREFISKTKSREEKPASK